LIHCSRHLQKWKFGDVQPCRLDSENLTILFTSSVAGPKFVGIWSNSVSLQLLSLKTNTKKWYEHSSRQKTGIS
jgi:hypothetical protein